MENEIMNDQVIETTEQVAEACAHHDHSNAIAFVMGGVTFGVALLVGKAVAKKVKAGKQPKAIVLEEPEPDQE